MIDWAKELNREQLEVVTHGDGPCLVLAGAGSGKTRTITYRVAYLLEQGVAPENILLVTFTNKAAAEMVSRLRKLEIGNWKLEIPPQGGLPWAGTFHHIAYKILRQYAPLLEYKNNFSILDSDDSEALIKLCAKEFKTVGEGKKFPSAGVLQAIISYARNAEVAVEEVLDARYPQWLVWAEQIKNIASAYALKKKEANAMDFDDLLVNFLRLLSLSPSAREGAGGVGADTSATPSRSLLERGRHDETLSSVADKLAEQFKYILVDEYQDTNKIQASIIKKLAARHQNILVVGDDAQSIYSFRAASIENILNFSKDYPNAKIFKLETNYRSSEEILKVANDVIANNLRQYKKELKTIGQKGARPLLHPHLDEAAEAQFIVKKISEHLNAGVPAGEIAVLFRAAYHSQRLEMELVRAGLSYDYRGGLRFFERAHIKDVLAYLRIINNLADTAAWLRLLTHEEGIGPAGAQRVMDYIRGVIPAEAGIQTLDSRLHGNDISAILGERAKNGWTNFMRVWEALLAKPKQPAELIGAVLESPYLEFLESEYLDSAERLQDLEQLKNFSAEYENLEEFLAEASLQEGFTLRSSATPAQMTATPLRSPLVRGKGQPPLLSKEGPGEVAARGGKIVLSTIHQAKGLEWSAVFVINLAAGSFPNERALREDGGLEEERRLFYVAITRAKKHLYLTYPLSGGGFGDVMSGPSMFLEEIDRKLLEDKSLLRERSTVLDDEEEDVHYIDEDKPVKIKPGSFLRDLDDL